MAMALTAWFSAPAPTTWTSTVPHWRTTPAMAPATEFGFERLDTLRISTGPPSGMGYCQSLGVRQPGEAFLPNRSSLFSFLSSARRAVVAAVRDGAVKDDQSREIG